MVVAVHPKMRLATTTGKTVVVAASDLPCKKMRGGCSVEVSRPKHKGPKRPLWEFLTSSLISRAGIWLR